MAKATNRGRGNYVNSGKVKSRKRGRGQRYSIEQTRREGGERAEPGSVEVDGGEGKN